MLWLYGTKTSTRLCLHIIEEWRVEGKKYLTYFFRVLICALQQAHKVVSSTDCHKKLFFYNNRKNFISMFKAFVLPLLLLCSARLACAGANCGYQVYAMGLHPTGKYVSFRREIVCAKSQILAINWIFSIRFTDGAWRSMTEHDGAWRRSTDRGPFRHDSRRIILAPSLVALSVNL